MMSPYLHLLPRPRNLEAEPGHTLIELLVALALVSVCMALPVSSMIAVFDQQLNRNNALICQTAAAAAQVGALTSASGRTVAWDAEGLTVSPDGGTGVRFLVAGVGSGLGTNVSRWRRGGGVSVRFVPVTASPDSAGSVYFGDEGKGQRVVVRLESGLTRRESR
ncbi:MAG: prepilin-type N-terminal cleavage/methylation domain-containing protein [Actinobacteria bacterium]|nr:prepilin-type N-terminal cleavage/methylation domain-containing protein [Actinomycetota bacterium]